MQEYEVMITAHQYVTVVAENEDDAIDRAFLEFDEEAWETDGAEIVDM